MVAPADPESKPIGSGSRGHRDRGRPMRRCIAGRDRLPTDAMIRFVVGPGPDGRLTVIPDLEGRLPGHGYWIRADRERVDRARRLFARAVRAAVHVPEDLTERLGFLLAQRCIDLLALARRAGETLSGFEKCKAVLAPVSGKKKAGWTAGLVLNAGDGAEDGCRRIVDLAGDVPVRTVLSRREIGRAFGRADAVHAVVAVGGLADRLRQELDRLSGFRTDGPGLQQSAPLTRG